MSNPIQFLLNGQPASADCRADTTVLEWLRGEALLRGTKEGCAEGDCGACSVLVKRVGGKKENYLPANSCIMVMGQLEGASLVTVEGLAALGEDGHAVQQRMAENGSSQCGFCTPGIVVALAGLLERNAKPDDSEIHDALAGNLCRCTGYRPIVEAAQAAAKIPKLKLPVSKVPRTSAKVGSLESEFLIPNTLDELLTLRKKHKNAVLLAGGTDLAIEVAHARARWPQTISTRSVAELREIRKSKTHLTFGGAVTWEEALPYLQKHWPSFATLVRRFGSTQIRSMGTIAGNLATASPIGDGAPALLALGAYLTLASKKVERDLPLDDFFLDYRKSALKPGEVISSIHVPLSLANASGNPASPLRGGRRTAGDPGGGIGGPAEKNPPHPNPALQASTSPQGGGGASGQIFRVYKVSKRYDQDISTVCGAFSLEMKGDTITDIRIAFGGMAAIPKRCTAAEKVLAGKQLDTAIIANAKQAIRDSFNPMTDMRGTADYRAMVAGNLLDRLALDIAGEDVEVMAL